MNQRAFAVSCALFLFSSTGLGQESDEQAGDLALRDVTVLSPERAAPLEHAYVLIRDGRIAQVSQQPLEAEREIDGGGRYLIPGLIDSHVHVSGAALGMRPRDVEAHPEIAAAARAQEPRSYLYFGFTTVVDLKGQADRIARWNEAQLRPDAYFCGGAAIPNGYGSALIPRPLRPLIRLIPAFLQPSRFFSLDDPYLLYDERQRRHIPNDIDPPEHTPEAVIVRMASDGAICVKTYYETGFGGVSGLATPTVETIRELVTAAHARDMPVLIHANSKEAYEFAVTAGVDITAHGMWNGVSDGEALAEDVETVVRAIVTDDIAVQPTLQVLHGLRDLFDPEFLEDPMLRHAIPPSLIAWYKTVEGRWFRDETADQGIEAGSAGFVSFLRRRDEIVERLATSEARLLFGSDTPSAPTYANPPGLNGLLEMRSWIAAGVSEEQLFRALTIENARAFGLDDEIGSIQEGKVAHLLLLRENPLESVDAYDTIETIILAGRAIERAQLSAVPLAR